MRSHEKATPSRSRPAAAIRSKLGVVETAAVEPAAAVELFDELAAEVKPTAAACASGTAASIAIGT